MNAPTRFFASLFLSLATIFRSGLARVSVAALLFSCKGVFIKPAYGYGAAVADVMLLRML